MTVSSFNQLAAHAGHEINCTIYGDSENAALECLTCNVILADYNNEQDEELNQGGPATPGTPEESLMSSIETIHHCHINYRWASADKPALDITDAVEAHVSKLVENEPDIYVKTFSGGPASFPYIKLESVCHKTIERVAGKIERYFNRSKDVVLATVRLPKPD